MEFPKAIEGAAVDPRRRILHGEIDREAGQTQALDADERVSAVDAVVVAHVVRQRIVDLIRSQAEPRQDPSQNHILLI